jgi:hypothetical protein
MKRLLSITISFTMLSSIASGQIHIKEGEAAKYIGKKVEVLGRAYLVRSVNKDYAVIKLGYSLNTAKLPVCLKFKNAIPWLVV